MGFSDNTALHLALARLGLVSFHAPHPGAAFPPFTQTSFTDTLFHGATGVLPVPETSPPPYAICEGLATGRLIGGNVSMLAAACGTPFALDARDRIVLLEDVGEATYRTDRALVQLRLSGAFDGVSAFALGAFTDRPASDNDRPLDAVIAELLAPLGVPILAGLPFGHIDAQWTLPLGALAQLNAGSGTLEILEPGVV
jgi:muramoyltetrapeptide carboxypeptidase